MKKRPQLKLLITISKLALMVSSMAFVVFTVNAVMDILGQAENGSFGTKTAIFSLFSAMSTLLFYSIRNLLKRLQERRGSKVPAYAEQLEKVA